MPNNFFGNLWEPSETFLNVLEPSGTFWNLLEPSGTFWDLLEPSGSLEFQIDHTRTDRHTLAPSCDIASNWLVGRGHGPRAWPSPPWCSMVWSWGCWTGPAGGQWSMSISNWALNLWVFYAWGRKMLLASCQVGVNGKFLGQTELGENH